MAKAKAKAKAKKAPKKAMGRPTKICPEITSLIVSAILAGSYVETASALAGISKDTFYNWLKKGAAAQSGVFFEFSDAIQKAMAQAEMNDLLVINKAAQRSWQAAAWKLERKYPNRWGLRSKHEIVGADKEAKPVQIVYAKISEGAAHKVIEVIDE
tara:strand:- start:1316 stop:1783 length:468 start_codon:yes stop_codon:yes gene_type:complete